MRTRQKLGGGENLQGDDDEELKEVNTATNVGDRGRLKFGACSDRSRMQPSALQPLVLGILHWHVSLPSDSPTTTLSPPLLLP